MAIVKIKGIRLNPELEVRLLCSSVTVSMQKNNKAEPEANGSDIVAVQTNSYNNPKYNISGLHFLPEDETTFQYYDLIALMKLDYDGTNAAKLIIEYGDDYQLHSFQSQAITEIPVIIETGSLNLDVNNSRNARRPMMSMVLTETK